MTSACPRLPPKPTPGYFVRTRSPQKCAIKHAKIPVVPRKSRINEVLRPALRPVSGHLVSTASSQAWRRGICLAWST